MVGFANLCGFTWLFVCAVCSLRKLASGSRHSIHFLVGVHFLFCGVPLLADVVFGVPMLIAYISSVMTLEPGDLIFTGTPAGVGPLKDGDEVVVEIEGLGVLRNTVKADRP